MNCVSTFHSTKAAALTGSRKQEYDESRTSSSESSDSDLSVVEFAIRVRDRRAAESWNSVRVTNMRCLSVRR
jgi:hypothetical protein